MLSAKSHAHVAAAGSGKTTRIVSEALATNERVLLTTYTNENVDQIKECFIRLSGSIPPHVSVMSWYSFLLQECIRPYQNKLGEWPRARSVDFNSPTKGRARPKQQYFNKAASIYADKAAEFAHECNRNSGGLTAGRLGKIYSRIYLDEVQDIAGYDLELIESFVSGGLPITMVGDPRQGTFSTNNSRKNNKYRRDQVYTWLQKLAGANLITLTEDHNSSHRCNQAICDFADGLFPNMPKTKSLNGRVTGHDGIIRLRHPELAKYLSDFNPMCLRYNKHTQTHGVAAFNIGSIKGREYDRVLIFPTAGMKKYLKTGNPDHAGDRSKLYIAVTRARFSVAFLVED